MQPGHHKLLLAFCTAVMAHRQLSHYHDVTASVLVSYRFVTTSRDSGNICEIGICDISADAL